MAKQPSKLADHDFDYQRSLFDVVPGAARSLRRIAGQTRQLLDGQRDHYFMAYYQIGQLIRDACRRLHARHPMILTVYMLNYMIWECGLDEHVVRACVRLVECFTEAEYRDLARRKSISWHHIMILLSVDSPTRRAELIDRVEREGLSPADLCDVVVPFTSGGFKRRRGLPRNAHEALNKLDEARQNFLRIRGRLFGDRFDTAKKLEELPPEQLTQALRNQLAAAVEGLQHLGKAAAEDACRLQECLVHLDSKLAAEPIPVVALSGPSVEARGCKNSPPTEELPEQFTALLPD